MTNEPQMPAGMIEVDQNTFFNALKADPRDIMPSNRDPHFSTWETKMREVWGWSTPGWANPRDQKVYAVFPAALAKAT